MIFVSLGTNDKDFSRLLSEIDRLIINGFITEDVYVQCGSTSYESNNMIIVDLMEMDEFIDKVRNCDLLITHGGVGTILDGLKYNKKIIAFPRLSKYKEHVNDHQVEIIKEFSECGYILTGNVEELNKLILDSKNFLPKKYKSNNYKFNKIIREYINSL